MDDRLTVENASDSKNLLVRSLVVDMVVEENASKSLLVRSLAVNREVGIKNLLGKNSAAAQAAGAKEATKNLDSRSRQERDSGVAEAMVLVGSEERGTNGSRRDRRNRERNTRRSRERNSRIRRRVTERDDAGEEACARINETASVAVRLR